MPHRLLVTVIAVAVTALGTLVSSARAHEPVSMDIRPLAFEVIDGPDDDQRVRLDATLYVPSNATPATPAPVVVLAHGFGGDKGDLDALARQTAHHGYLALAYSARGFGRSTGAIGLDSLDYDVKDVRQIVDALAEVPEVALDAPGDPRIGLSGRSYGGGIALMAATQDRRIDAIAPRITWSSLAYSLAPNNLAAPEGNDLAVDLAPGGVLKAQWSSIFFGLGAAQPLAGGWRPAGSARWSTGGAASASSPRCAGPTSPAWLRASRRRPPSPCWSAAPLGVPRHAARPDLPGPRPGRHPVQPGGVGSHLRRSPGQRCAGEAAVARRWPLRRRRPRGGGRGPRSRRRGKRPHPHLVGPLVGRGRHRRHRAGLRDLPRRRR